MVYWNMLNVYPNGSYFLLYDVIFTAFSRLFIFGLRVKIFLWYICTVRGYVLRSFMKLSFYLIFIFVLCLMALPFQMIFACIIAITSGFPILFRQRRTGKDGKQFIMYKFRTMKRGAEKLQKQLQKQNEADGPVFKIRNDPRFTPFGKFLSHTGLDELPQLWNVLKGDMALIGPRPLPVSEARKLTGWQQKRHAIKPGIISPWVLNGYHSKPFDTWMKSDIAYTKKKSGWYDMALGFQMIPYLGKLFLREVMNSKS
jgi:lipopolysaccharide/colanic/teichoic acid biosynthesis glycosyltransferase